MGKPYVEDREAILLAERLGYCEAFVGEHITDLAENVTSCLMFLASLAHQTTTIVLGSGTINMPNSHPAAIAAQVAMIDHMLRGRFIMGISPGGLMSDAEVFGNYGKDRNEIFLESINMVLEIWKREGALPASSSAHFRGDDREDDDPGDRAGHDHQALPAASPADRGDGGGAALERRHRGGQARLAADLGQFLLPEWVASHWPRYVEGRKAVGAEPNSSEWRVAKSIFVADDDKVAKRYGHGAEGPYHFYFRQLVRKLVGFGGRSNSSLRRDQSEPDDKITPEYVTDKLVIAGTVNSVVEQLLHFAKRSATSARCSIPATTGWTPCSASARCNSWPKR